MVILHLFVCLPRFRRPYTSVEDTLDAVVIFSSLDMSVRTISVLTHVSCL